MAVINKRQDRECAVVWYCREEGEGKVAAAAAAAVLFMLIVRCVG